MEQSRAQSLAVWILLILLVVFLRLPSFVEAFFDPDVAATVYSAQLFAAGGCLYPEAVETKPPGSYAVFALLLGAFHSMLGVQLFLAAYHLAVAFVLAKLVESMTGRRIGWFAALFYGVFSAGGFVNGFAPNFETWTLLPLTAAVYLLWQWRSAERFRLVVLAGLLAGLAVLMKQQGALPALALGAVVPLFVWRTANKNRLHRSAASLWAFGAGALLPWALTLLYFAAKGCADDLLVALNPWRNVDYAVSRTWSEFFTAGRQTAFAFARHTWLLMLLWPVGLFAAWRRGASAGRSLWALWLLGSLAAVVAGTKFFTHYYFFLLPPLCGLAALGIEALATKFSGNGRRIFPLLLLVSLLACQQRELRFAALGAKALLTTGRPVSREIFTLNRSLGGGWLDFVTPYNHLEWELASRTAGKYIRAHSAPDDGLLVYDYLPSVYWYARRFAPTRHHMNFEVAYELAPEFGKWYDRETARLAANRAELLDDLRAAPPAFIVRARYAPPVKNELAFHPSNVYGDPAGAVLWQTPLFADLAQFVAENYHEVAELSDLPLLVLQRNDHLP
ncbi:MAG TPA: hypothetical protein PK961_03095 [bacterium]|nr:hypothetical protein [bacterium]